MVEAQSDQIPKRHLGKLQVGAIGVGGIAVTGWYGEANEQQAVAMFRQAHEYGVDLIDTADIYGPFTSEEIVGRAIKGLRHKVVLATKGGLVFTAEREKMEFKPDASPAHLRTTLEASLKRLQTDYVDLYYLHRTDPNVPIEDTIGFLADMVRAGKIRGIGLCEVSLGTLKRAQAVHPLTSVQSELSLWERGQLAEVLPWCQAHGVGFAPYAPLGRGFLAGNLTSDTKFAPGDFRGNSPRFTPEAIRANNVYLERIRAVAQRHGSTLAVVTLAWLLHQAPNVVPIPGMEKMEYLTENIKATRLQLSAQDLAELDSLPPAFGSRHRPDQASERFDTTLSAGEK